MTFIICQWPQCVRHCKNPYQSCRLSKGSDFPSHLSNTNRRASSPLQCSLPMRSLLIFEKPCQIALHRQRVSHRPISAQAWHYSTSSHIWTQSYWLPVSNIQLSISAHIWRWDIAHAFLFVSIRDDIGRRLFAFFGLLFLGLWLAPLLGLVSDLVIFIPMALVFAKSLTLVVRQCNRIIEIVLNLC